MVWNPRKPPSNCTAGQVPTQNSDYLGRKSKRNHLKFRLGDGRTLVTMVCLRKLCQSCSQTHSLKVQQHPNCHKGFKTIGNKSNTSSTLTMHSSLEDDRIQGLSAYHPTYTRRNEQNGQFCIQFLSHIWKHTIFSQNFTIISHYHRKLPGLHANF